MENQRIPIHGSMTRPANPEEGLKELIAGRLPWEKDEIDRMTIEVQTEEFMSNCPTTGQPDFYRLTIRYQPEKYYLESKTVKFYLWSFFTAGFHCERLAKRICQDIATALETENVTVTLEQKPRGGLGITSTYTTSEGYY